MHACTSLRQIGTTFGERSRAALLIPSTLRLPQHLDPSDLRHETVKASTTGIFNFHDHGSPLIQVSGKFQLTNTCRALSTTETAETCTSTA